MEKVLHTFAAAKNFFHQSVTLLFAYFTAFGTARKCFAETLPRAEDIFITAYNILAVYPLFAYTALQC